MKSNAVTIAATLLVTASTAFSASITVFAGANCSGAVLGSFNVPSGECLTFGGQSGKSISYSGVPSQIRFYESGGPHDACTNGAQQTNGGGSGCATAPAGFNWESVAVN